MRTSGGVRSERARSALAVTLPHDAELALQAHGWPLLSPMTLGEDRLLWRAGLPVAGARQVEVRWGTRASRVTVRVPGLDLDRRDHAYLRERVRWMFRGEEDFRPFWRLCQEHPVLRRCVEARAGALWRSPTVFEDVVKTLCTVNCHWRNTKRMLASLCRLFGAEVEEEGGLRPHADDRYTFPPPETIAKAGERRLAQSGLGYRAPFVKGFARAVAAGALDLDAWTREADGEALRAQLLAVPGIGPYAANHMLVLLGHYAFIPCDSEVCAYLGLPPRTPPLRVEQAAQDRYGAWGPYAFLAYKFEWVFCRENYVDAE